MAKVLTGVSQVNLFFRGDKSVYLARGLVSKIDLSNVTLPCSIVGDNVVLGKTNEKNEIIFDPPLDLTEYERVYVIADDVPEFAIVAVDQYWSQEVDAEGYALYPHIYNLGKWKDLETDRTVSIAINAVTRQFPNLQKPEVK